MQFRIQYLTLISLFFSSCSTVQKAFDPQRKNSSEEFLVEKKSKLIYVCLLIGFLAKFLSFIYSIKERLNIRKRISNEKNRYTKTELRSKKIND